MLLAFVLIVCFALPFWLWRKTFSRKDWIIIVAFAFLFSLLLALISIWSVWTPYVTRWNFHDGEFDGYFPWSKSSYPLYLNVYPELPLHLLHDERWVFSGSVSFKIFLANVKVMRVNGTFSYILLSYSIDFPLFNNGGTFFIFLLMIFTLFNIMGALLGIFLVKTLLKKKGISQQSSP